jgi:hypothetical protein
VPFADSLAEHVGRQPNAPRILRDYSKLLALIKAVAVLRHTRRHCDAAGRLVAVLADYQAVYDLVREAYATSASGASTRIRETVQAVVELRRIGIVRVQDVADRLGIHKSSASRRVQEAIAGGWLMNAEWRANHPAELQIAEELPPEPGLPSPSELAEGCTVATEPATGLDAASELERAALKASVAGLQPQPAGSHTHQANGQQASPANEAVSESVPPEEEQEVLEL